MPTGQEAGCPDAAHNTRNGKRLPHAHPQQMSTPTPAKKEKKMILHWAEVTIYDLPRSVCSRVQKELITYRVWILKNIRSSQFHLR